VVDNRTAPTIPAPPCAVPTLSVTLPVEDLTEPVPEDWGGDGVTPEPPDEDLTCVVCGGRKVTLGIRVMGDGRMSLWGLHERCLPRLQAQHPAAPRKL